MTYPVNSGAPAPTFFEAVMRELMAGDEGFHPYLAHPGKLLREAADKGTDIAMVFESPQLARHFHRRLCSTNKSKEFKEHDIVCLREEHRVVVLPKPKAKEAD